MTAGAAARRVLVLDETAQVVVSQTVNLAARIDEARQQASGSVTHVVGLRGGVGGAGQPAVLVDAELSALAIWRDNGGWGRAGAFDGGDVCTRCLIVIRLICWYRFRLKVVRQEE